MLRRALSVLPTRPAMILAPCVMLLVLGFYYSDRYQTCRKQADFRQHVMRAMAEVDASHADGVDFAKVTNFAWDTVQILTGYKPKLSRVPSCPFGWDWDKEKIQHLADSGRLTMLAFTVKGRIKRHLKLDSALIDFSSLKDSYSISEAKFKVLKDEATDTLRVQE